MISLIGILIVVVGFIFKKDILSTILVAGIATGLVSNIPVTEILTILGDTFVAQRLMTIFILTLPIIGICERYGLKDMSIALIKKTKNITTGKILTIYTLIRELAGAASIRISGHPQFIRPLINPMAQGAAISLYGPISPETEEEIKAASAAVDNYGNFFGQNVFLGASGTLLITGTLAEYGMNIEPLSVAVASIPIAVIAFVLVAVQNKKLDMKIKKQYKGNLNTATATESLTNQENEEPLLRSTEETSTSTQEESASIQEVQESTKDTSVMEKNTEQNTSSTTGKEEEHHGH